MMNRCRQGALGRPSVHEAVLQSAVVDAGSTRPLAKGTGFSIPRHGAVGSAIIRLLMFRGPSAISRVVVARIVDAVQRIAFRTTTHVPKEGRVISQPLVGHCDTTPAVVFIAGQFRVVAACFSFAPRPIFSRLSAFERLSVLAMKLAKGVSLETSATFRQAVAERFSNNGDFYSAYALTAPRRKLPKPKLMRCSGDDRQTAKDSAGHVFHVACWLHVLILPSVEA
jgi:hypothetical protein